MRIVITNYLKNYPLTLILVAAIWYLSLFTPPQTRLDDIRFIDKWAHFGMYALLTLVFGVEAYRSGRPVLRRLKAAVCLLPALMGGLVELAQAYCTDNRTGDWFDFLANGVGVIIGVVILFVWRRLFLWKK